MTTLFVNLLADAANLPPANVTPFDPGILDTAGGSPYKNIGDLLSTHNALGLISPVTLIFFAAGFFFLINILLAGFALMTSAGNPQGLEGARVRLTNSAIGLALVFTAYFIVQIVGRVLNLPGITNEFG